MNNEERIIMGLFISACVLFIVFISFMIYAISMIK